MARSPKAAAPSVANPDRTSVAVVGGGLAGLASALKLARCGYAVTLYEAADHLGGNISSELDPKTGLYHDVYPHIFCSWYDNFWDVFENELGLPRDEHFETRECVKFLDLPDTDTTAPDWKPQYRELRSGTTLKSAWANLTSGVLPFPDMFLLGFSMIDIAGHPRVGNGSNLMNELDVNGFIYSRGYFTEEVATLQNYILKVIWSLPSTLTAANSYQDFVKHGAAFPRPTPFAWFLKGSLEEKVVAPWTRRLTELGCEIRLSSPVREIALVGDKCHLRVGARGAARHDFVVLAVPPKAFARLVLAGEPGQRIADRVPDLSQVQHAKQEAIPVVVVYFKKKLTDVPKEVVGLKDSTYDLSMIDISQLWDNQANMAGRTVIVLAASNGPAIPSQVDEEMAYLMISRLHDYLPIFNPGKKWGDDDSDINWQDCNFRANKENLLFVNDVASLNWRPQTAYPDVLPNVVFAGDVCQSDVNMATIEASVQTGIAAAAAIQARRPLGAPIMLARHPVYDATSFLVTKLALLPFAYAATGWSGVVSERSQARKDPNDKTAKMGFSTRAYSLLLPSAFVMDWWITAYWLARSLTKDERVGYLEKTVGVANSDRALTLGDAISAIADEAMKSLGEHKTPAAGSVAPEAVAALGRFATRAVGIIRSAYGTEPAPRSHTPADPGPYRRRWRAKG